MDALEARYRHLQNGIAAASGPAASRLLAVSKLQPAASVRALARLGQRGFGENYVQEALAKQGELSDLELEWHLIGPLQSNKCRDVARHFDWVQSVDRDKLPPLLDRERPAGLPPLNVLLQVNVDGEAGKAGCAPEAVPALAAKVAALPRLRLRGLMAIPEPHPDPARRRAAFAALRKLFDSLGAEHPDIDTLSMGMSDDYALALAEGATLIRVGTALFGPRPARPEPA